MRLPLLALVFASFLGCGPSDRNNNNGTTDADQPPPEACVGLQCQVVDCEKQGKPPTSLSGTVFAPNGTLALFGVTVYVPNFDPGPFPDGAQCSRCDGAALPGEPIAQAMSDEAGNFSLSGVPAGSAVPLIVTIGKWRRIVVIPQVEACTDNPLPADLTRLPQHKGEGDIPKIAMGSGACDRLECLLRKLGISDYEFTSDAGDGSIHLYNGGGLSSVNGETLPAYSTLTGNLDKLKSYDIVMFSCDCGQDSSATQAMMDNIKAYADIGGRAFLSHYHSQWISGNGTVAPAVWPEVAACTIDEYPVPSTQTAIIDQTSNPKGTAFAQWMVNVMGSTVAGQILVTDTRETCSMIDPNKAERWVHLQGGELQNFQFTTPSEVEPEARCGKVVMSDMHVSGTGTSGAFPAACGTGGSLSPQEKALAFMFFDIASCVGIFE